MTAYKSTWPCHQTLAARWRNWASAVQVRLEADDEHRGFSAGGKDQDAGEGAVGGGEEHQVRRYAAQQFPWGAGAGQEPHDQPEIVAGDVDEVAFVPSTPTGSRGRAAMNGACRHDRG